MQRRFYICGILKSIQNRATTERRAKFPSENDCSRTKGIEEYEDGATKMTDAKMPQEQTAKTMTSIEGKYLTFSLAKEEYGLGILKVKEIIGMMPITTVPRTPGFIRGVINLRGKVIPVIDLRLKFGMEEMVYTDRTCIIVVETRGQAGPILIGIVVDAVAEVMHIKAADVEEPPALGARLAMDYILGMAKMNGGVKILLDIDKVLGDQGIPSFDRAA
jgi:purine-binding chemotaxis protein CheW